MSEVVILGCGMVGWAIAIDMAADPSLAVTVADVRPDVLEKLGARARVRTVCVDLSDAAAVTELVRGFDLALGALPSRFGLQTLRAVIEAGTRYVDISFMAEDALELSPLARERGVVCVVDCGVGPGVSNLACGYATTWLQPCERLEILVGGLPEVRSWPFDYKVAFAPADVLEEYTRPARMVERGEVVVYPALSGIERVDIPGVGTLEAFNTDGLRSLIRTLDVPNMTEKTMRWPGHAERMQVLAAMGLFGSAPIDVGGQQVVPIELAAALLFPQWTYQPGEVDITVMRVTAIGMREGERVRMIWELLDRYDAATELTSMSRTTGFPATIVARMVLAGRIDEPGVHPPELLGKRPGVLDHVLAELALRGVVYRARVEAV
ncbi:MAG: saccharopine dehydrogenase NADP-binding domain-containing protein [Deltaproteobacteria bacterium]|nr:saccharopine dehydrogenase NADP-binding domain-containing protein [Nannocystaceae bacterium]